MEFTSRQLRALIAIADRGSFSRAADVLYMTPSGVSVLLREIESQLGFRVFERSTRHVSLTEHGAALVPVIRRAVDDIDSVTSAVSKRASTIGGSITIGAAPLIAANVLPPAIKEFRARRPGLRVRTFDADLATVMQKVASGTLDLAIGVFTPASNIKRVRLFRFSFIFIRSGDDLTPRRTATTWSAAASEPLIALPSSSPVQRHIDRQLARARVRRSPAVLVNALDTQIAMVEAGEGVAIIPSFGLPVCRNRNVAMSRLVSPVVSMDFHQIWARGRTLPPAAEEFAAFLQSHVARWAGRTGIL
jgi:LysR family transcriptional regulator, carnitine catabolism transcriptional activator